MKLRSLIPTFRKREDESRARAVDPQAFIQQLMDFFSTTRQPAGVTVTETTSLSISAVFACVRNLAEDVAKLPFIVYRNIEPRGKERLPGHPLYRLLHDEPNPEMSAFDFRQAITASAVLWGGGFAEIETTNNGVPIALWPLEPWRVCTERDRAGRLRYLVDGNVFLDPSRMIHVKGFGVNGITGMMLAQVGKESLGLTIAAQRFAASFFGNGAKMSGVLQHPKTLTDAAIKHLRESFSDEHAGPANAHKPLILEEGSTWTQNSVAPNEAQMLETRLFQVEDVARWFRMPPHKIQHLMRSTFSNIEHQGIEYVVDTLTPWLVRWEQETKRKLVDRSDVGVFAEHLVAGLLRGDITSRYAAYAVGRQNGWINANQIRELENMNAIEGEGGEAYLINGTMITLDAAMKAGSPNTIPQSDPTANDAPTDTTDPVNADQMRAAITDANRLALQDAAQRAIRREVEVIRRKTKAKTGVKEAIEAFYGTHNGYVRSSIQPAITAFIRSLEAVSAPKTTSDDCIRAVTSGHIEAATQHWSELFAGSMTDEQIDTALNDWEARRAGEIVESILEKTNG